MSDEPNPPGPPSEGGSPTSDDGKPTSERPEASGSAHRSSPSPVQPDATGIIDLDSTQSLPTAPSAGPGSGPVPPAGSAGWFDTEVPEHPAEGPGVPARADDPWGSDRADAHAEAAHRAAYTPPPEAVESESAAGPGPRPGPTTGPAPSSGPGSTAGPQSGHGSPGTGFVGEPAPGSSAGPGLDGPGPPGNRPKRRRGWLVAGIAALALVCGLIGGIVGQLVNDRVHLGGSTIPQPGPAVTARPSGSVAAIAASAVPSVVTIQVRGDEGSGTGSGFVIDDRGHVLTNNHVIGSAAAGGDIEVLLSNGDTVRATIVGRDVSYDLAVLKMDRQDLKPLTFGASDGVVVGDQVIAVGAPLGLEQTVTTGIVSALNRPVTPGAGDEASYINAIQTDAAINPGNSGGPLLDMSGQVIGVNSAIARVPGTSGGTGGNIGLGFAIPSDQARRTAEQLITTGKATHPIIGATLDRTFSGVGAQVIQGTDAVIPDGPAAKAGLRPGDVITAFEGQPIRTSDQLIVSIRARAVGETVTLTVERGGQELDLTMTLEDSPTN